MSDRRKHRRSATAALPTITDERLELLRHIVEAADLIDVGPTDHGVVWLLVPLPHRLLDVLEEFVADFVEDDDEGEPDVDDEPSIGAPEHFSQLGWGKITWHSAADIEADDVDREGNGDDEPNEGSTAYGSQWWCGA